MPSAPNPQQIMANTTWLSFQVIKTAPLPYSLQSNRLHGSEYKWSRIYGAFMEPSYTCL